MPFPPRYHPKCWTNDTIHDRIAQRQAPTLHPNPPNRRTKTFAAHLTAFTLSNQGQFMNRCSFPIYSIVATFGLFSLLTPFLNAAEDRRTWTDNQGREVIATFDSANDETVVLLLEDGRKANFPIADLSANDQSYIESKTTTNPTAKPATQTNTTPDTKKPSSPDPATGNWDDPWPLTVRVAPTIEIEEEINDAEKRYIYRSPNFEFTCDARLNRSVVQRFALIFESTHQVMREIPLNHRRTFDSNKERFKVQLMEDRADYLRLGMPPNSAGAYLTGQDLIVIPLASLGVIKTGTSYRYDHERTNTTLIHEIAHQLQERITLQAGWYFEGMAEYLATIPYRSGTFNLRNHRRPLIDFVTSFSDRTGYGRNIGTNITMPSLENFMNARYQDFSGGASANRNYGVAALLFYYFAHMDKNGDAEGLKAYTRALQNGISETEAQKFLLAGRSYEDLQEDFAAAWRPSGITFQFPK